MEPLYKKYSTTRYDPDGTPAAFTIDCPDNFNFAYDVVDAIAAEEPDKEALVWCSDNGGERRFTFSEMSALSSKAANLFASYGITKGSHVLLMLKRHYSYWYTVLALHKLGAIAIPATHMLTEDDLKYRAKEADIKAVICVAEDDLCRRVTDSFSDGVLFFCAEGIRDGFIDLESEIEKMPAVMDRVDTLTDDPMLMYFTSGTTGDPKAVLHSYAYPLYHIPTALYWHKVTDNGLHLSVADTGWGKASWGKIYGQWLCGSAVMVYHCRNLFVSELLGVIKKYNVTTFCAPPTVYRSMVKNGFDASCFKGVKCCVSAGESLKPSIAEAFTKQTGLEIHMGYGQTETALVAANLGPYCGDSLGKPMPLYDVKLLDADGSFIKDGQGELVLRPTHPRFTGICLGYVAKGGKIMSALDGSGLFHTGDIASFDENGQLIFIGRTDDMIKSSGYRISPQEIENVLMRHPDIVDCAVAGVPDGRRGTLVKAFIVLKKDLAPSDEEQSVILKYAHENLAGYKCPRAVEFREHLPKTISGKLRRAVLASGGDK